MEEIDKSQVDGGQQVPRPSGQVTVAPHFIDKAVRTFCKDITTFLYQYAERAVNDFIKSEGFVYLAEKHCKGKGWRAPRKRK